MTAIPSHIFGTSELSIGFNRNSSGSVRFSCNNNFLWREPACLPSMTTEKKHDDTCCKIKVMKNTPLLSPRLPLSTFSPQQRHQWRNPAAAAATAGTEAAHYLHAPRGNPMHEPSRGVTAWRRVQACMAYILSFKNVWHSVLNSSNVSKPLPPPPSPEEGGPRSPGDN